LAPRGLVNQDHWRRTTHTFADGRFDDFSEAEVLEIYLETFPADRKAVRSQRWRGRQLALLRRHEAIAAKQSQDGDLVACWFDDRTADKLTAAGIISLGELNARIHAGGPWYRTLPGVGDAKAQRIAQHLANHLPTAPQVPAASLYALTSNFSCIGFCLPRRSANPGPSGHRPPLRPATAFAFLDFDSDSDAIQIWLAARAASNATAKAYQREAAPIRIMLHVQCRRCMAQMDVGAFAA
jgi:hypothetical protein